MTKAYSTWALYIVLFCSVITFLFGAWMTYRAAKVNSFGLQTEGTIVEYTSRTKNPQAISDKGMVHTPIFSFTTKDKVKYTLHSSVDEEDKMYEIGEKILIKYDPENPKSAYIAERFPWVGSAILLGFGLFGILVCVIELKKRL